jgi:hypothetical protein
MGKLCSKQTQTIQNLVEAEKEFSLLSYKSDGDKIYDLQENKFNYFRKMLFQDFLYSLVQFSGENATLEDDYNKANIDYSMKQPFFNEAFSTDYLQSFIENKILKHKALYEDAGTHENIVSIFKEEFLEVNNSLGLKLSQNAKGKGDENADKNTIVKKGDVIAYGILYCAGANYVKTRALFNLFEENGEVKKSDAFSDFLLALFLTASYCMASARNKLKKFNEIGPLEKDKLKELLEVSELKDCQNLVDVTNKLFFGEDLSLSLNYTNFKAKFADDDKNTSLAFILSPSGVRFMLKKNNV